MDILFSIDGTGIPLDPLPYVGPLTALYVRFSVSCHLAIFDSGKVTPLCPGEDLPPSNFALTLTDRLYWLAEKSIGGGAGSVSCRDANPGVGCSGSQ